MIKKLAWDSDFFELNVGEFTSTNQDKLSINSYVFDLIYIKSDVDFRLTESNFTVSNEEVKLVFSKKIKEKNSIDSENIFNVYELENLQINDLYALAFLSGKYSRFNMDPNISSQRFRELYVQWINNTMNKSFNDYCWVYKQENQIVAMLTFRNVNNYSQIGLIAVDEKFKGKGIGSKLLQNAENYCLNNNIYELRIPTQQENISACNFYRKNGYEIIDASIIKHAWRNRHIE